MWSEWTHTLAGGLVATLELTAWVTVIGVLLSLALAACAFSEIRTVRWLSSLYSDVMRSIPLLPALVFVNFGIGSQLEDVGVTAFWVTCLVLILIESGYTTEVFRGIFKAMAAGQWEAARSLGMPWFQIVIRVLIPSALPALIPVSVNGLVLTLKDTSLASIVAFPEITLAATTAVSTSFQPLQVYILLGGFYLAISLPVMGIAVLLERRLKRAGQPTISWRNRLLVGDRSAVKVGSETLP
jgi:His/Glu/Gln/Arg/opine family amino acid ABC transporter permease subunit